MYTKSASAKMFLMCQMYLKSFLPCLDLAEGTCELTLCLKSSVHDERSDMLEESDMEQAI